MSVKKITTEGVLDLWRMGCGGTLKSAARVNQSFNEDEAGVDYPLVVSLHVEGFFRTLYRGWRDLAAWAADNGYQMREYPVWLVTPDKLFALGMGELITRAPRMRGQSLYGHLSCQLMTWLESNPLPEQTGWFEE